MNIIDKFSEWAEQNDWKLVPENEKFDLSVHPILREYDLKVSPLFCEFITRFAEIVNADETKWFFCARDFKTPENEDEFAWDEFRTLSLEYADGNEERSQIEEFWREHLPFLMTVGTGYEYWALDLTDGKIVNGYEPIFEETTVAADSFGEFLEKIVNGDIL